MTNLAYPKSVKGPASATTNLPCSEPFEQIGSHVKTAELALEAATSSPIPTQDPATGINRLPVEVLTEVFAYVRNANTITRVCRFWRAAALDCASLWTDISFCDLKWAEVHIVRSKDALVDIHGANLGRSPESVRLLQRCIPRARSLDIVSTSLNEEDPLVGILSAPRTSAPSLEIPKAQGEAATPVPNPELGGPELTPLRGVAPHLKTLKTWSCAFPWPVYRALGRNLVHLHVDAPHSGFIGYAEAMTLLEQCPLLESFVSTNWYPSTSNRYPDTGEPVRDAGTGARIDLPRLTYLTLEGLPLDDTVKILAGISAPHLAHLALATETDAETNAQAWSMLLPRRPALLSALKTVEYRHNREPARVIVDGWTARDPYEKPDFSLVLNISGCDARPHPAAFAGAVGLAPVETLTVWGVEVDCAAGWRAMLRGADRVRALTLRDIPRRSLCALFDCVCEDAMGADAEVLRSLAHLAYKGVDWDPSGNEQLCRWKERIAARAEALELESAAELRKV